MTSCVCEQVTALNECVCVVCERVHTPIKRLTRMLVHHVPVYDCVCMHLCVCACVSAIDSARDGPILLLPSHRSYLDFLLISYIFFAYDLKCPFIAAGEEFAKMSLINHVLRKSGKCACVCVRIVCLLSN